MKKPIVILLPVIALLTSCGTLKFGYTEESREPGLEGSISSTRKDVPPEEYGYYSGDSISTEDSTEAFLTFNVTEEKSELTTEEASALISCSVEGLFKAVDDLVHVSTDGETNQLYVGAESTYAEGYMTFSFNNIIKDIIVEACPYYYSTNAWNEDDFKIDSPAGVGVNESQYVKLSSEKDETEEKLESSMCRFHIANDATSFKIKVGPRRAFIRKISLYF